MLEENISEISISDKYDKKEDVTYIEFEWDSLNDLKMISIKKLIDILNKNPIKDHESDEKKTTE
jgi:hypothetical protein